MTMVLATLASSCAVQIKDEQFCSPVPGDLGAVCDNFLTSNQLIMTEAQWQAQMLTWQNQGLATECTNSQTLADIKSELEKLCSLENCDYPTQQKVNLLLKGLNKVQNLGLPKTK